MKLKLLPISRNVRLCRFALAPLKDPGRNRLVQYRSHDLEEVTAHQILAGSVSRALEAEEPFCENQPQIDLATRNVVDFELVEYVHIDAYEAASGNFQVRNIASLTIS